jgi:Arc/MetJ-type ribon-helix-helix transcriptional regulator
MKAIRVEVPDKLAAEIQAYVKTGWFKSEAEVGRPRCWSSSGATE